jgi:hypothetical protein
MIVKTILLDAVKDSSVLTTRVLRVNPRGKTVRPAQNVVDPYNAVMGLAVLVEKKETPVPVVQTYHYPVIRPRNNATNVAKTKRTVHKIRAV